MRTNLGTQRNHVMLDKSFKAPAWMLNALHKYAHAEDISDSEWVRNAIMAALIRDGFDLDIFLAENASDVDVRRALEAQSND